MAEKERSLAEGMAAKERSLAVKEWEVEEARKSMLTNNRPQ